MAVKIVERVIRPALCPLLGYQLGEAATPRWNDDDYITFRPIAPYTPELRAALEQFGADSDHLGILFDDDIVLSMHVSKIIWVDRDALSNFV